MREASLDNTTIELSWLGRLRSTLPRSDGLPAAVPRLQPPSAPIPTQPLSRDVPGDVLAALEVALARSVEAPSVPDATRLDDLPAASLEVMQERYPLLRNAL